MAVSSTLITQGERELDDSYLWLADFSIGLQGSKNSQCPHDKSAKQAFIKMSAAFIALPLNELDCLKKKEFHTESSMENHRNQQSFQGVPFIGEQK